MPELAEVEFCRRQWMVAIGERVERVTLHERVRNFRDGHPRSLRQALCGVTLLSAESHGKQLLFGFSRRFWLSAHLGMSGKLFVAGAEHIPQTHDHLVLYFPTRALVYQDPRQFGRIRFERSPGQPEWWRGLPPPILSVEFTLELVRGVLARHSQSLLKPLLLNQAYFPGIGNWMADEVLWRAHLHPATPVRLVTPQIAAKLWEELREVCREAVTIIGEQGVEPPDTWLFPHRWSDGNLCPAQACGASLSREEIRGRTACWCPRCQPA
jgi:formamidopyrimidine-DNA glycosylase